MSHTHSHPAIRFLFTLALALFAALPASAAKLVPDKSEIAVGETVYVKFEADLALLPDWSAGDELEILSSSGKGATVKGVKPGKAKLTVKYLGGKKSTQIVVRDGAVAMDTPASPTLPAYTRLPAADNAPALPATGEVLFARESTTSASAQREVFTALGELARRDQPLDLAQAREFFRLVQNAAGTDGNVWNTLRAVKRANKANWDSVQNVENQLVALVRDTLVRGRENVLRRGGLGTVFAFLDSGKWRNRATNDLFFDTDFDTTFFADRLVEVDPDGRDTVISRVEDMLAQQLGVGSRHLGIELTGFGYEAQGDNYVSKSGIKWALRESASHIHLIDPASGRIGPNIANHPNVLFARQQEAALRLRHPELFDSNGRLLPNITRAEVQRRLQAEPGLSRSERMFAEGARMNVTDAALAPIDMACHLSETQQSTNPAEDIAKISKQVARSTAVFIEGMGGGEAGQRAFTPAELEFMRVTRQLETAKIERAAAEAQVARFMAENPASSTYSEAQIAELDRLLEQARTQKALVERTLADLQSRWSASGVRTTALTVLKKQARTGFDASLRDLLGRQPAERTRGLGDFAREMEVLARHYENKGAPAEMLQWARQGLETSLILHEMSRDARFGELWTAFERMGRAGPREVARLKEFLNGSEAGRRLLARVGVALDNIVNPPKELALGHPMAEASRSLREIAGSYTALVGHTALLVGLVDSAYQAKTNEEFAVNLAHTLIGTTTVGLILQEGQQLILGGDPKAGARLLAYLLIPETMLPALVDALGHSTINLGTAIAFDTQLDALYLVSKFDQNGALTEISGYPRGQLAEMVEDILGVGGYQVLEEMVNKAVRDSDNFFAEQAKMVNETMKRAVVSALSKTFVVGNQMVFKDDATLSAIVGNVHKYQEEIKYLAQTFGIEAPLGDTRLGPSAFVATAADFYPGAHDPRTLTALDPKDTRGRTPNVPHWATSLDRGQLRAIAQLFVTRDWWGNEARKAFIATLIRTLEERHRAEQDVDANLRDKKRQELMDRFAELDITEQGTDAYNQEAGYHLVKHVWNVTLGFATPRERAVHEMKALNRYLDVYNHVRDLRFAIEAEITRRTGRTAAPRPLTSTPALTAVPAIDYPAADSLAREIGALGDALSRTLTQIKGAPLEGDYDTGMFARIYEAQYLNLYWSEARKSTAALKQQVAAWKIVAKYDLDALREDCHNQSSAAWKLAQDLIEEFRNYYANQAVTGDIRVSPSDLTEGDRFTATLVIAKGVPPVDARWIWQADGGIEAQGAGNAASGVANGSGSLRVRLVGAGGKTLADISTRIDVKTKPDGTLNPPGGPDGNGNVTPYKPSCSYEYTDWGECSRATKKQTRSVKAKSPANCEERQKPVVEQGCTPPPTEEEKRHQYFNCLCRCYSGWAGHIGVWYDPEGKSIPEAKSSGPCFGGAGAWGATRRHYFGGPNECSKGCWEGVWGKGSYDPGQADKLRKNENKKYKQPLKVELKASKNPADFGDIVDLTAEASEGTGGYSYAWGGCAQDAKDASAKVLNSRDCKPCAASVTVTDQDGESASDSLTIQCTALTVKLTKERPAENSIPVGGSAALLAEVFSGDKPAGGGFTYYWEPNPDVQYGNDPRNPAYETSGGAQSRNTAVFRKLGATPVWVTVLKDVGGRKMTMGESEQIRIDVVSPKLSLKADKANPVVGETVTVTVEETPKMGDELLSFWWEYKGDAGNPGPVPNVPNSRAWSFKPKNDKPVTVTVHAKSKDNGDELDSATLTVTAQKAEVTVTGPRIPGPAPMIWKEGVGHVPAERQVAEDMRVEFAVTVNPAVGDLRYAWRVEPAGCTLHSPYSRETGVTCGQTGGYTLTATVKNADGAELGSGTGNLSVTVSQAQIKQGQQKAEAGKQLDQAKQAWGRRDYDQAVGLAEAAAKIDKGLAQPVLNQFSQGLKQQGWDALHNGDRDTAIKRLEQAARLNPDDADARKKLADARDHVAKWPQVEAKVRQFDDHIANKRIWSAQKSMLEVQDILRTMAAGQSSNNPTWKRVMDDFNTGLQDYNRFSQEKSALHTQYFKEENYPAMLANAESMRERELSPADEKECQSRIDFAKHFLQAAEFARQADDLIGQGQYEQALAALLKGRDIHPKSVETTAKTLADTTKRLGKEAESRRDFQASGRLFDIARKAMPQDNEAHIGANNAPVYQKRVDEVRAWHREVEGLIAAGDWDKSEFRLEDVKRWEALIPGEMFPETKALIERQEQGYAAYKAWVEPLKQQVGAYMQRSCLDKAYASLMEMRSRHLIWMDQDWTRVFLDAINEGKRTCSMGNVPLKNNCGRDCDVEITATGPGGKPVSASGNGATLSLDSDVVEPNATIALRWSAPADVPNNTWVGLQPADKPHGKTSVNDQFDMAYRYIDKARAGTMNFTAPNAAGRYDLRMNNPANDRELVSVTFEVRVAGGAASLTLPKTVYAPGEKVVVNFTASAGYPKNTWVGLIPSDKPHGKTSVNDQFDMAYKYVDGKTGGSLEFVAPGQEGRYDLRMNETSNDKEVASVTFQVGVPTGEASLRLAKGRYAPGEPVRVDFTASANLPKNTWVGLQPADKPHGKTSVNDQYDMAYKYVDGKTGGSLDFTAPVPEGRYDLRMNETSNDKEIASVTFQVAVPVEGAELSLPKSAYKPGEAIRLGFKASTLLPKNTWVGLIPSAKPHGKTSVNDQFDVAYRYVDGMAGGELSFNAPGDEGNWDFRMNETSNDREVVSLTFRVDRTAPTSGTPIKSTNPAGASSGPVDSGVGTVNGGAANATRDEITSRYWRFGRGDGSTIASRVRLTPAGKMEGYYHSNEDNWALENGVLVFRDPSGRVMTRFTGRKTEAGVLVLSGPFLPDPRTTHVLTEVGRIDAPATPGGVATMEAAWVDLGEDKVGEWGNGKPNGVPDAHLRLTLGLSGRTSLASLSVWGANEAGAKSGGHVWHSQNSGNWMLGVFRDGRQLNASHVAKLGEFDGRVTFDLYANQSGWFVTGQSVLVEAITGDGKSFTRVVRVGSTGGSQAGSTSATLRLDKTRFVAGERISVHFTAPTAWPGDAWVGIVPSGIPHGDERQNDNHDIAYQYLDKRASGTLTFTAPAAGNWDFRLHDTDGGGKEHASVSFTVGAAPDGGGRDYTANEGESTSLPPATFGDWETVETKPGMYRFDPSGNQVRIARRDNNPGGIQNGGLRLVRGLPITGDFEAQVSFTDAQIAGGLNQIELQASFADGGVFFVVRDREGAGSHVWAPGLRGDQPCGGGAATLRLERRGGTVTGYCNGRAIWSDKRTAALTRLQFVLQNNGTNDAISATFRDWRFSGGSATSAPAEKTGAATLTLEKTRFEPGESIRVRFTAPSSWPGDAWVGIVPSGIPHGDERQNDNHDIAYQYLDKRASGILTFTAPAAGNWDFRVHDTDNGGKEHASVSFTVGAGGGTGTPTVVGGKAYPVNGLGDLWEPLSAVGGDFQRFARFDSGGLAVDVPAGNHWGKTGIMSKKPMLTIGKTPITVTVAVDPARTSGLTVAFAAAKHPDVALIDNAWMSWVRRDDGSAGDLWIGNVQDSWAGRNKGQSAATSTRAPVPFVLTLEPGKMSLRADGRALSVAIGWLKEGVAVHPHIFSHPTTAGKAAKFALTGFRIDVGGSPVPSDPGGRDYTSTTATGTTPTTVVGSGPETTFQGHRYRAILTTGGISWPDADRAARALGGYLATITSQAENDVIYSLIRNDDRFWFRDAYNNGIGPWLGGYQPTGSQEPRGGWRWITGETFAFTAWGRSQPDNGWNKEHHLQFFGHQTLKSPDWNDIDGNYNGVRGYIVEFGETTVPTGGRDYTGAAAAPATSRLLFEIGNIGATENGPRKASKFTLDTPHVITAIQNYHWNHGRGAQPGTIALRDRDKNLQGPWPVSARAGQGGAPNVYWTARPNVTLPAGTYTVVDSDPDTWSHNAESGQRGFIRIEGYPAGPETGAAGAPVTGNAKVDQTIKEVDELLDAVKSLKGLFGK